MAESTEPKVEFDLSKFDLSQEAYLAMDPVEFRGRFRERVHHTLEIQTYAALHSGKVLPENQTKTVENLIGIWKQKGLSTDLADFQWGQRVLNFARAAKSGQKVDLSEFKPHPIKQDDYQIFQQILTERRSVRHWTDEEVPDWMIDEIVKAGLWGAHSCNLQSLRFVIVREKNEPGLFRGSDVPGGPVHIVALQDERVYLANPYNPVRNRLIDCGAAVQNMVLAAHALGLGGVWLTFSDQMLERLYQRFQLPEQIKIVTYIDVGFPDQTPAAPNRLGLKETVLLKI
jgi:Nitroreductase